MIYCWMVSKGVSGGKEFVKKLPSERRNWSQAEMLSKNKKSLHRAVNNNTVQQCITKVMADVINNMYFNYFHKWRIFKNSKPVQMTCFIAFLLKTNHKQVYSTCFERFWCHETYWTQAVMNHINSTFNFVSCIQVFWLFLVMLQNNSFYCLIWESQQFKKMTCNVMISVRLFLTLLSSFPF